MITTLVFSEIGLFAVHTCTHIFMLKPRTPEKKLTLFSELQTKFVYSSKSSRKETKPKKNEFARNFQGENREGRSTTKKKIACIMSFNVLFVVIDNLCMQQKKISLKNLNMHASGRRIWKCEHFEKHKTLIVLEINNVNL